LRKKKKKDEMVGLVKEKQKHQDDVDVRKQRPLTPVSLQKSLSTLSDSTLEEQGPLRPEAWAEVPATSFDVRGKNYLRDKKKAPSEPSLFTLLTVDLVQADRSVLDGLCKHPEERIQTALKREAETGIKELPNFIFAFNIAVPGPPFYHMVAYFGIDDIAVLKNQETPCGRLMSKFFFGDSDKFRDNTFKLIPRIVEGHYIVRKAVGKKPSILGRKVKQYYVRDENERFFELILDVGSEYVAEKLTALGIGYARSLTLDMMLLFEGADEDTLPERILGGVRLMNLDFKHGDARRIHSFRGN